MVRNAPEAGEGGSELRRAAVCAVAVCAVASLGACRTAHEGAASARPAAVQSADCDTWRVLPQARRQTLLTKMHTFFGSPVDAADAPGLRGSVLTTDQASQLFDNYCGQGFARAFKLYKIYGRAAAFTPSQ